MGQTIYRERDMGVSEQAVDIAADGLASPSPCMAAPGTY